MDEATRLTNIFITSLINPFIGLLAVLAFAIFIWGIIGFMANADNEEARAKGKRDIVWGLLGLFIMFSVWGIITIVQNFVRSF